MASEKERAREEYLRIRELALKEDKKARLSKVWMDTHYLLCMAVVIIAAIYVSTKWTDLDGSARVLAVVICIAIGVVFAALGTFPTKKMLKHKKELHDLQQKLDDLESRYHL